MDGATIVTLLVSVWWAMITENKMRWGVKVA